MTKRRREVGENHYKKDVKHMKKFLAIILTVAMAAMLLAGCGSEKPTDAPVSSDEQTEAQKFIVGFDAEYPPFGYMDEKGEYVGFDLEIAAAVCEIEGWELVKTPIDWDAKDQELNAKTIDCIWSGFTINGRENDYCWSNPYVDNSQVVVVKDDSIKTLADLAGKVVGVQQASAAYDVFEGEEAEQEMKDLAATFAELQQFADYNTAFAELLAGSIDALAIDIGVAKYQVASRGEGVILEEALNSEQYGVGFRVGETEIRDTLNKDLKTLYDNGTITEIAKKYGVEDMVVAQ